MGEVVLCARAATPAGLSHLRLLRHLIRGKDHGDILMNRSFLKPAPGLRRNKERQGSSSEHQSIVQHHLPLSLLFLSRGQPRRRRLRPSTLLQHPRVLHCVAGFHPSLVRHLLSVQPHRTRLLVIMTISARAQKQQPDELGSEHLPDLYSKRPHLFRQGSWRRASRPHLEVITVAPGSPRLGGVSQCTISCPELHQSRRHGWVAFLQSPCF